MQGQGCGYLAYLDDVLIHSRTEKEHLEMLENTLEHILKAGLKIKLSKCSFFKEQINYLGHLVSGMSIIPLADTIEALMKLKPPINVIEVRHLLALTGYYCKLICNYKDIAYPLNCLTCKAQPFVWTLEFQASVNMLCLRLINTTIIQIPDPNKPYLQFTDASKSVIQVSLFYHPLQTAMKYFMKILTSKTPLTSIES